MGLPASSYLEYAARTVAEMKQAMEDQRDFISSLPGGGPQVELTIAAGSITPTARDNGGFYAIDTEADAAADTVNVFAMTNVPDGALVWLFAENAARVVTLEHANGATGQMLMVDSADFVLDALDKWICFQRQSNAMVEIERSYGNQDVSSEWHRSGLTPTRVTDSQFTVPGDQTAILHVGRRLQTTDTAGTDYMTVTGVSYSDPTTTVDVVVDGGGALDSGLATVNYGQNSHAVPSFVPGTPTARVALNTLASKVFTVPAWATEVTIHLMDVTSEATNTLFMQMGDAGGMEATGYKGAGTGLGSATNPFALGTAIFLANTEVDADLFNGKVRFELADRATNTWSFDGHVADEPSNNVNEVCGTKALSGPLTQIGLYPGATEVFDGGYASMSYR